MRFRFIILFFYFK